MINIYPSFYNSFSCIAGKCPDTCCAKWEIVVDTDSVNFYNRIKTKFGERLRGSMITDSDGDVVFKNIGGRCPFLNERSLCDIYTELGEQALCKTCAKFPRYSTSFGGTREWGLSLACPVACDLILKSDLALISEFDTDDPDLNELDADLYLYLKDVRGAVFKRMESDFTVSEMLAFGDKIENGEYVVPDFEAAETPSPDPDCFRKFEYLTEKGREVFLKINSFAELKLTGGLRRIFSYYIYRYLLASVYDGCLSFAFRLASFAVCAINTVAQNENIPLSEAAVLFSKEIEYSETNLAFFKNT